MKKNILSVVAVGLVLSTFAGVIATQPADAQCNNNNNRNRNQARQIRRMLQQQARCNQSNNPYFTQVNPGLYNNYLPVGYNNSQFGYGGNQFGFGGNQFYGNPYYNNGLLGGNGMIGGNGLIGGGLQRVLGTLF